MQMDRQRPTTFGALTDSDYARSVGIVSSTDSRSSCPSLVAMCGNCGRSLHLSEPILKRLKG